MAICVTGKLNKAANQFQAGDSVGFGVQLGVKCYDRESKKDEWCNYAAVIFAKAPAQIQFYQSVLVEGAIIEVSGDKCKIRQYQGQNGLSLSIEILDAKLGAAYAPQGQQSNQQAPQRQQQQQGYAQPQQRRQTPPANYQGQMPQQNFQQQTQAANRGPMEPPINFDDEIPF